MPASKFLGEFDCEYEYFHNIASESSERSSRSTISDMDFSSPPTKESDANRILEESRALWRFAKMSGGVCVTLIVTVFGFDQSIFEEIATLLVHNVVAALILIFGLNLSTLIYDAVATPVPGSPEEQVSTPLQGLVRRPSRGSRVVPFQRRPRSERPDSITVPQKPKRSSGGLFSGLWPRGKRSSSSKNKNNQEEEPARSKSMQRKHSRKLSKGRHRGWPSGRLSSTGSI